MGTDDADGYFTLVANSQSSGKLIGVRDGNLYIGTPEAVYWGADANHDGSSEEKAYIITTPEGLDYLASECNSGNTYSNTYFMLGKDITYTHKAANEEGADTENNYTAIGNDTHSFFGTFNGNNKTISGIRIYKPNDSYQGLFGYSNGKIQNVIVSDAVINGQNYVGGIAGYNAHTIKNCFVDGTNVNVSGNYAGAIVGAANTSNSTLQNNYYHSCTRTNGNNTVTTGIGTYNGDINQNNGACAVFTITTAPGVSINPTAAVTYQNVNYYTSKTVFGLSYTGGVENFMMHAMDIIPLLNGFDNSSVIAANQGSGKNVVLTDRKLYRDGAWNTLCLPFDVSTISGTLAGDGVTAMVLDAANSGVSGSTLTLNFNAAPATIPAGTPFIIKWNNTDTPIVDPVFTGVTISNNAETIARKTVTSADGKVSFQGTYSPVPFTANDKSILFLGAENKLYWPSADMNFGAFRAYFKLNDPTATVKEFRLSFGEEDEVNGVSEVNASLEVLPSGQAQAENDNRYDR